ncbi:MAG: hypothetical protein BWX88_01721 [Planctomycetes bacterium ADurb.Bin126]|nr:MAG: hypothetical protein BWX88_01721 [Planctomycetes bacterium ADurb.Bin126]HOD83284.1 type II secretion system protein [Phycisphaerae bacterium]HQL73160.1 type II secretion system protein [Phycisphaerae bacterium]
MASMRERRGGHGFTLVELLVVVSIIVLLLAILTPSLHRVKKMTYTTICGSNTRQFAHAMNVYGTQHKNEIVSCMEWVRRCQYPPWDAWPYHKDTRTALVNGLLWKYLQSESVYICPVFASLNYPYKGNPNYGLSYTYAMNGNINHLWGATRKPNYIKYSDIHSPQTVFLLSEEMPWATPGFSVAGLNDGVLLSRSFPSADSLAYLHGEGTVDEGLSNVVFADCHVSTRHIWETKEVTFDD